VLVFELWSKIVPVALALPDDAERHEPTVTSFLALCDEVPLRRRMRATAMMTASSSSAKSADSSRLGRRLGSVAMTSSFLSVDTDVAAQRSEGTSDFTLSRAPYQRVSWLVQCLAPSPFGSSPIAMSHPLLGEHLVRSASVVERTPMASGDGDRSSCQVVWAG